MLGQEFLREQDLTQRRIVETGGAFSPGTCVFLKKKKLAGGWANGKRIRLIYTSFPL